MDWTWSLSCLTARRKWSGSAWKYTSIDRFVAVCSVQCSEVRAVLRRQVAVCCFPAWPDVTQTASQDSPGIVARCKPDFSESRASALCGGRRSACVTAILPFNRVYLSLMHHAVRTSWPCNAEVHNGGVQSSTKKNSHSLRDTYTMRAVLVIFKWK